VLTRAPRSLLLCFGLLLAYAACSGDDDSPAAPSDEPSAEKPDATTADASAADAATSDASTSDASTESVENDARFVLTVTQYVNDVATSYLLILDDIDAGEISLDRAREFAGGITTVVRDGYLFIAEDDAPVVSRYMVSEAGELTDQARISFADYGVQSAAYGINFFASSTRSYITVDTATRVVWDPSKMEVVETLKLDLPKAPEDFELNASYDRGLLVRDQQVFQSLYTANWDELSFAPESHIAIWNSETDEASAVTTSRCPMLDAATQDDAGNVYYSNWVHLIAARYTNPDKAPKPCVVRIPAGSTEIDQDWTRDLTELTDGRPVMNLQYSGDGKFIASVFHEERAQKPIDSDQVYAPHWRMWSFDFEAGTAEPVDGVEWNDGGFSTYRIDGHTYVLVTTSDSASTFGYEIKGKAGEQLFHVSGAGYQIGKL